MGKISENINGQIHDAMRKGDEIRLSTLRLLASALSYEKIAQQHDLTEEEELSVVRKEAKKRVDAIEVYQRVKAPERAEKEKAELAILREYLPAQLSDEDLQKLVDEAMVQTGAKTLADMGKVIGVVMGKASGQADGKRVSEMIKIKLSSKNNFIDKNQ